MKIINVFAAVAVCALLGLTPGCGKKEGSGDASVEQQMVDPAVFARAMERAQALIKAQNYDEAKLALKAYDGNKQLTPEQQELITKLKAQIPAN